MVAVNYVTFAGTNFRIHKEVSAIAFFLVLLCKLFKLRDKTIIESQTGDMSARVNTESIHTHLDKLAIALYKVVGYIRVLGVEVHAVACNLSVPTRIVVPVPLVTNMVPIVVGVVVLAIGVLHFCQTLGILLATRKLEIVIWQSTPIFLGVRNHTCVDVALVSRPIASEEFAEVLLAEVTCVVEYDIQDDLHTFCVSSINQILELYILALIALIYFREVACVIAMIVVARGVFHHRSNPNSSKSEGLDIVQFLNQTFEVATPSRVAYIIVLCIPTLGIIVWVTVVETGGHYEVDLLVAEVGTRRKKRCCICQKAIKTKQREKGYSFDHNQMCCRIKADVILQTPLD